MPDPEAVAARKQLVKQLKAEGKSKQEIKDAVRDQLPHEKKPRLDDSARNELMKSLQEFRAKTSEKIKAILTDQQRVAFEQLIQERKDNRDKANPGKRKGKKPGKDKSDSKKTEGGGNNVG
jgi:Spy/CpxP family protein refolding chaperone